MVDYAQTAHAELAGRRVRIIAEPLLRRDAGGTRRQSLRIDISGYGTVSASRVDVVETAQGDPLPIGDGYLEVELRPAEVTTVLLRRSNGE